MTGQWHGGVSYFGVKRIPSGANAYANAAGFSKHMGSSTESCKL